MRVNNNEEFEVRNSKRNKKFVFYDTLYFEKTRS